MWRRLPNTHAAQNCQMLLESCLGCQLRLSLLAIRRLGRSARTLRLLAQYTVVYWAIAGCGFEACRTIICEPDAA